MSILKSMCFGCNGTYDILGIPISFEDQDSSSNSNQEGMLTQYAKKHFNNSAFRWITKAYNWATQGYAHVLVHEMGHALTSRLFPRQNFFSHQPNDQVTPKVKVFTTTCEGATTDAVLGLIGWKKVLVCAAGPLANIAFSACKLVAVQTLKTNYFTWPIAAVLECGAIVEIGSELYYAYDSSSKEDDGDFGRIAREGNLFLCLASTALITECALGVVASGVLT